jgi:hypothetical protein
MNVASEGVPNEGDFTVCAYCSCVMRFDADLKTNVIKDKEMLELKEKDPETWKTIQFLIETVNKHK